MNSLSMLCAEAVVKKKIDFNKSDIDIHSYELIELYKLCDKNWNKVIIHACQKGYLSIVRIIIKNNFNGINNNFIALRWAVARGHLDITKYIMKYDLVNNDRKYLLELAAEKGHLEIFKHIFRNYIKSCKESDEVNLSLVKAVKNNHLEIVKYLINKVDILDAELLAIAFKNYNLTMIKYLISAGIEQNTTILIEALKDVIMHGNLEIIQYILELNKDLIELRQMLIVASKFGHLNVIKYLVSKYSNSISIIQNNDGVLQMAAIHGNLNVIKYYINEFKLDINIEGPSGPNEPLYFAAQNDHFDIVKFIIKENEKQGQTREFIINMLKFRNNHVLNYAISNINLDMVKYVIEKIGYIESWVMDYALTWNAFSRDGEIIKYIFDKQCANGDIDDTVKEGKILLNAIRHGYVDMIKSFIKNKYESTAFAFDIQKNILLAIEYGQLDIVKYFNETIELAHLIDIRIWDDALIKACEYGHLEIVKYIIQSMDYSLKSADFDIINDKIMQIAIKEKHTEIVEYLESLRV